MKTRDRRGYVAAATVLKSLGDQSGKVASIRVDGKPIDLAEAVRLDREQASHELKLPGFLKKLVDRTQKSSAAKPGGEAEAKKPSMMSKLRDSRIVKKALDVIQRDAATVSYRADVDVMLTTGASEHFTVDAVDGVATRRLRSVMLATDMIVAAPLPPGFTSALLAPVAVISALAAVLSGLGGDAPMKEALKRMTYKELALIPIGEIDQTGLSGVTALAADLNAAIHPSQAQGTTVGEISRWVASAPA